MTSDILPQDMINFALTMFKKAGETSRRAYEEAEKNPKTDYGIGQLRKGTTYSNLEILCSMAAIIMAGVNVVNKKIETLAEKKDISALKSELTEKVNETLVPLRKKIKDWEELEKRGADIYE
jgi:hypothetical protein